MNLMGISSLWIVPFEWRHPGHVFVKYGVLMVSTMKLAKKLGVACTGADFPFHKVSPGAIRKTPQVGCRVLSKRLKLSEEVPCPDNCVA